MIIFHFTENASVMLSHLKKKHVLINSGQAPKINGYFLPCFFWSFISILENEHNTTPPFKVMFEN